MNLNAICTLLRPVVTLICLLHLPLFLSSSSSSSSLSYFVCLFVCLFFVICYLFIFCILFLFYVLFFVFLCWCCCCSRLNTYLFIRLLSLLLRIFKIYLPIINCFIIHTKIMIIVIIKKNLNYHLEGRYENKIRLVFSRFYFTSHVYFSLKNICIGIKVLASGFWVLSNRRQVFVFAKCLLDFICAILIVWYLISTLLDEDESQKKISIFLLLFVFVSLVNWSFSFSFFHLTSPIITIIIIVIIKACISVHIEKLYTFLTLPLCFFVFFNDFFYICGF